MNNKPIFILGAPRSGTTFLASLLEKTVYGAPFETHFITKYYSKLESYGDINNFKNFERLLNDILSERAVMQWDLTIDKKIFFQQFNGDVKFALLADKLCFMAAQKKGYQGWGDKTPGYVGDFSVIEELFPDSKYLYIVRDGRDVALSLMQKDWGPNNVYYCAEYWAHLNRNSSSLLELRDKGQLYYLRYEDLLDNVEFYIDEIYKFLDMEYTQEDLLELSKTVQKGNYNKWKKHMSNFQIQIFENMASGTLRKFGYETSHEEKNIFFLYKLGYKLHNLVYRARHLFIVNVIDTFKIKFLGKSPFAE